MENIKTKRVKAHVMFVGKVHINQTADKPNVLSAKLEGTAAVTETMLKNVTAVSFLVEKESSTT